MEDDHFYNLFNYFGESIKISEKKGKAYVNGIPLPEFPKYSKRLASRFMGEIQRNLNENWSSTYAELDNIRFKFNYLFVDDFCFEFNDPERNLKFEQFIANEDYSVEYRSALIVKLRTFNFVFEFIDKKINEIKRDYIDAIKKTRQPRRMPGDDKFNFDIPEVILHEIHGMLVRKKYIENDTDPLDFINIFSGKKIKKPIKWLNNNYQLKYLISELNKLNDKKLHDGIWHLTSERFVNNNGSKFDPKSLMKASKSKNENLDFLNHIITIIQESLEKHTIED